MTRKNLISRMKKSVLALTLAASVGVVAAPAAPVIAAETTEKPVLVYSEQEGMGSITSYLNDVAFKDSASAVSGDVVRAHAEYNPGCTFTGWYLNGNLKTTQKDCSFTVADESMYILSAKYQENGASFYAHSSEHQGFSATSWANRTCRFAQGTGKYDVAVTTAMAVQGEKCIEAFNAVKGDYTLARTYNITFTRLAGSQTIEALEAPADFVFQLPKELQSPGRSFHMINVFKGQPTVLEDKDATDETITFTTERSGAFALVYKDAPVAEELPQAQ